MRETTETKRAAQTILQFDNAAACCLVCRSNARGGGDFISQRKRWRGVFAPAKSEK